MGSLYNAKPKKQRRTRGRERGVLWLELAVAVPLFTALVVGAVKTDRSVNASRIIERAIGEALLQHALEGEIPMIIDDAEFRFTYAIGDDSQDSAQLSSCGREIAICRAAGDASLRLARAVRASFPQSMDTSVMKELLITLTYEDLPLGSPADYTIPYGKLTIRVDSAVTGGILSSASVTRSEVIG